MRYNVEHKQADILSDHERIQFQGGYNIMKKKLAVLLTAALAAASLTACGGSSSSGSSDTSAAVQTLPSLHSQMAAAVFLQPG